MSAVNLPHRRWILLFLAVACLVLAQVAWWAALFVREVDQVAAVRREHRALAERVGATDQLTARNTPEAIAEEAKRRRIMFLSEATFFSFLTVLGLYLIYHSLRAEARSREAERSFLEIVSHESKTPLTALKLRLESAREKRGADAALSKDLGLALDEVRRLSALFDKAMSLNRVERQALSLEVVSLTEIVSDVLRRLDPFFRANSVAISSSLDGDVLVRGDLYGLSSVIQNLIENAVLYNDRAEKKVAVAVREQHSVAVFSIEDNGPGIDPAEQEHIFDRFYRGGAGRRVPGTGLGLYIARSIVTAHKGALRIARSGAEGTVFEIDLPAVKA